MGAKEMNHISERAPVLPTSQRPTPPKTVLHPSVYAIVWIALSSVIILFNKWILDKRHFRYPVLLTTWHLIFATAMTQILARTTRLLDGRKAFEMTGRVYLRAILPIGLFFSLSLICGNLTYLYLSVSFIQMLKATTPVAVLLASWALGVSQPRLGVLINVSFIVIGVALASFGEIKFVLKGFLYQCGGILFEALRLVLVQRLLNGADYKMDPLVSLYYFAPACALMNGLLAFVWEIPKVKIAEILAVGIPELIANAGIAFLLNVSVVFLIGKTSSLVLTLCGVLKDILLIAYSMLVWDTPVSDLQAFGYTIALCGLVYYKVGSDQLKGGIEAGFCVWRESISRHPLRRTFSMIFIILVILSLFWGLASKTTQNTLPEYNPSAYRATAADKFGGGGV